jgi:hypothetical protein
MHKPKHDCPFCRCGGDAPQYPITCPVCKVLYGPGRYPDTHPRDCNGRSVEELKKRGAEFAITEKSDASEYM